MNFESYNNKQSSENNNQIAIDFDGVIHKNSKGFYDGTVYDEPMEGIDIALKNLSKNYKIVIFTCKVKPDRPLINGKSGKELIEEWLSKYNLSQYIFNITCEKPRAKIYIDDKGYRFENWGETLKHISKTII
jgi:histidinol phosphatase-like enzyme